MKTLLSILIILSAIVSQAQTSSSTVTVAQKALSDFYDKELSINFDTMTTTQLATYLKAEKKLIVAAKKEANLIQLAEKQSQDAANLLQTQQTEAQKQQFILRLKELGFKCDNSQEDWYKLYNRPEMFGSTWQATADYQKSISTGADYFIAKAQEILFLPYEVGKYYIAGNTFVYSGEYYKVVQPHTSQKDWIPTAVPALYTKVVSATNTDWTIGVAYKVNDVVVYSGSNYKCLQAHTSQAGWTPIAVPALWQKL